MKDSISLELNLNVFLLLIYYEIGGNRTPRMCFIRKSWQLSSSFAAITRKELKKDREKAIEERRQRRMARLRGEQPDDSQNLCIPHLRATFPKPAHVLQSARSLDSMEEQLQFSLSGLSVNTVEATAVTSFVTKSSDDDAPKNWEIATAAVTFGCIFTRAS